jgi:hypothetical protein
VFLIGEMIGGAVEGAAAAGFVAVVEFDDDGVDGGYPGVCGFEDFFFRAFDVDFEEVEVTRWELTEEGREGDGGDGDGGGGRGRVFADLEAPGADAGVEELDFAIVGPDGGADGFDVGDPVEVAGEDFEVGGVGFDRDDLGVGEGAVEIEGSHAGVGTEVYDGKDGGVERKSVFFIDEDLFVDFEVGGSGAENDWVWEA